VIVAHVMGIPIEESILELAPAGAAMVTAVAIAGRASLGRLRRRLRDRSSGEEPDESIAAPKGHGPLTLRAVSLQNTRFQGTAGRGHDGHRGPLANPTP
jgi:hypothetical protein